MPDLSHTDALRLIDAVRTELDSRGSGAAVAVVDAHGELVAFVRTDGCRFSSITIAVNKAFTAAREQIPTAELGARSRAEGFPMSNFGDPRFVSWGGGVPLLVDGELVGAIGVSGLPEHEDVELAVMAAGLLDV
jgi:glc operon protein GlcG